MDGFGKTLFWFSEQNLTLEVPFFQRPYVWDEENWRSLVNSIENAKDTILPFIGSFILQEKTDNNYWVIDGQQRITTLTIMIKCLLDYNAKLSATIRSLLEGIVYRIEIADIDNIVRTPRLVPAYLDKVDYDYLMTKDVDLAEVKKRTSKIAECYGFFYDYFASLSETDIKAFTSRLLTKNKYIIAITLDDKDDEQEIFDTVNSLGKRLTNSDIVKNYLYQQMKNFVKGNDLLVKQVLEHYNKYWDKVFYNGERRDFWDNRTALGRISTTNLDSFLKDFGTIKGIYVPSDGIGFDGLAKQYKAYINTLNYDQLVEFSKDLSSYAETYYNMKDNYSNCNDFRINDVLNTTLLVLDKLELTTFNPYVLELVKTNPADRDERLFDLQRFVLKRYLWKGTIKNYNKCCIALLSSSNPKAYLESYNEQSLDVQWDYYPQALKNAKNNQATLILFLIEMIRRNEKGEDNYSDTLLYNKTLEHIMPQKWEKNWGNVPCYAVNEKNEYVLVTEYDELVKNRRSRIYSIGNMTLLASKLNTSISNDSFKFKIEGKKDKGIKFFVGSLSIAQEIVDTYNETAKWDERDIIDRELKLFNEINSYYNFVSEIKIDQSIIETQIVDETTFTDNYFEIKKIGALAKESFTYLISNNKISQDEITKLKDKDYCRSNTGCALSVLVEDIEKTKDEKGVNRYYKEAITNDGHTYYLCKEWYENDRKYLVPYIKKILNNN